MAIETDIASAATTNLGSSNTKRVRITGTTTITSFGTSIKRTREIRFASTLTLTHNATTLILPTSADIRTEADDTCIAKSDDSGNWRVTEYLRKTGERIDPTQILLERNNATASAGVTIRANRSKGTVTAKTVVATNDTLSLDSAYGYDGSNYRQASEIIVLVIAGTPSSTDMMGRWQCNLSASGSVTPTQVASFDHGAGLRMFTNTVIDANRHLQMRSYTVATLPSAATAGQWIYVSDETGGAVPAFSDGTNWRRVTDRAICA